MTAKARAFEDSDEGSQFESHNIAAEQTIGVRDITNPKAADLEVILIAVALQVSFQIQQGMDPYIVAVAAPVGSRGTTFRGPPPTKHIGAAKLVEGLVGAKMGVITSRR